jgi:hypothetical protein
VPLSSDPEKCARRLANLMRSSRAKIVRVRMAPTTPRPWPPTASKPRRGRSSAGRGSTDTRRHLIADLAALVEMV